MRTTLELLFGIQPRSGKLLHLLGCLSRYTRPNCEQLEVCLDIKHLLCRNQAKIENICRSWRSIWLVTVQCFIVACLAGLNTAASVFFLLNNNEYPDISKSARTSAVVYCSIRINHQMVNFAHAHAMRTRLSNSHPRSPALGRAAWVRVAIREPGYEAKAKCFCVHQKNSMLKVNSIILYACMHYSKHVYEC